MKTSRSPLSRAAMKVITALAIILTLSGTLQLGADDWEPADSINRFAFDSYRKIGKGEGNRLFSPLSLSAALTLAYAGAAGQTADEMGRVLHFPGNSSATHKALAALFKSLQTSGQDITTLEAYTQKKSDGVFILANSLWAEKTLNVKSSFIKLLMKYYDAEPHAVDFINASEAARIEINGWVENKTMKKIKNLLNNDDVSAATLMVLINAGYFRGAWLIPFRFDDTAKAPFWITPTKKVQVDMMKSESYHTVYKGDGYSAVKLPYEGMKNEMIIILPEKKDGLGEIEKNLDAKAFASICKNLEKSYDQWFIEMPRFHCSARIELGDMLQELGIKSAFTGGADFSGMTTSKGIYISKTIQKAFIKVWEHGTEAAFATAVIMEGATGMMEYTPLVVDRPFLYFIVDSKSGLILLMGRVVDPTKN